MFLERPPIHQDIVKVSQTNHIPEPSQHLVDVSLEHRGRIRYTHGDSYPLIQSPGGGECGEVTKLLLDVSLVIGLGHVEG